MNPVLRRELVERWRGRRAMWTLTIYLGVLGGICYLLYRIAGAILGSGFGFGGPDAASAGPLLGRFLVEGLLFFILLLVMFVAPGYSAAQISGERERRTLALLQVTLLRPSQIVFGKLGASTAWLALLVMAALPLGAAAFFLGGVGIEDLLRGVFMVVALGVCVAGMGLGISSLTKRTTGSVVLTYGLVLALVGGTLFLSAVEGILRAVNGNGDVETPIAMYANPFYGLADAAQAPGVSGLAFALPSPLGLFAELLPDSQLMSDDPFVNGAGAVGVEAGEAEIQAVPNTLPPVRAVEPSAIEKPAARPKRVRGKGGSTEGASAEPGESGVLEPVEVGQLTDEDIEQLQAGKLREAAIQGADVPLDAEVRDGVVVARRARAVRAVQAQPQPVPLEDVPGRRSRRPVWLITLGIYAALGGLGLLVATRRLRVVEPRGRVSTPLVATPLPPQAFTPPGAPPPGAPPSGAPPR